LNYRENFSNKRRRNCNNDTNKKVDLEIIKSIKNLNQTSAPGVQKEESSNSLFCKSLVAYLDVLPPEKNMLARIKIQQVLFDIKYGTQC